jgi:hypothetical protein
VAALRTRTHPHASARTAQQRAADRPSREDIISRIDLDALKAQRAEALAEPHELVFGGQTFQLPAELPGDYIFVDREDLQTAFRLLLGEEQWAAFLALKPTISDFKALTEAIPELYGLTVPNSSGSATSSRSTGTRSRPTSPGSTTPISAARSGARKR